MLVKVFRGASVQSWKRRGWDANQAAACFGEHVSDTTDRSTESRTPVSLTVDTVDFMTRNHWQWRTGDVKFSSSSNDHAYSFCSIYYETHPESMALCIKPGIDPSIKRKEEVQNVNTNYKK